MALDHVDPLPQEKSGGRPTTTVSRDEVFRDLKAILALQTIMALTCPGGLSAIGLGHKPGETGLGSRFVNMSQRRADCLTEQGPFCELETA
jgi:hypothetical protein